MSYNAFRQRLLAKVNLKLATLWLARGEFTRLEKVENWNGSDRLYLWLCDRSWRNCIRRQMLPMINNHEERNWWKSMHLRYKCIMKLETSKSWRLVLLLSIRVYDWKEVSRKYTIPRMRSSLPFPIRVSLAWSKNVEGKCGWVNVSWVITYYNTARRTQKTDEDQWERASKDFFQSFNNYSDAASPQRIQVLKYLVLANLLQGGEINPFDSTETKP